MKNNAHIDYLTITIEGTSSIPTGELWERVENVGGSGLYAEIYKLKSGVIVKANEEGSKQGTCLIFGGKTLEKYREVTGGDREILNFAVDNARNITRIDFALNFHDCPVCVSDFHNAFVEKKIKTKARIGTLTQSFNKDGENIGETFYIGSRQSESFFRAYDKAKEQKLLSQAWLRAEMEWKGRKAHAIASAMRRQGIGRVGIANMIKFVPINEIEALKGEIEKMREWDENDEVIVRRKETDLGQYLKQVFSVILKRYDDDPHAVIDFVDNLGSLLIEKGSLSDE